MPESLTGNLVSATWSRPLGPPTPCPDKADVVIIGGGIVGCATAYFLAKRGISVILCEKGHIAGEQSGRNWGWVRQQGRAAQELPMMINSLRIWKDLADEIGQDVGFVQGGCLYLAQTDEEMAQHARWLKMAQEFGLDTQVLTARELAAVLQGGPRHWTGALYTPSDGRAEPHLAAPAIAKAAQQLGATVLTGCAVRGIETESGAVAYAVTERGSIRSPAVLCAGGAWTSLFCSALDIVVPQLKVRNTVARTGPAASILTGAAWAEPVAIRRRQDNGYTVAHGSASEHFLVPASFRFFKDFLPAMRQEAGAIRVRLGKPSVEELKTAGRWNLDAETPFERVRVLNPAPSRKILGEMRAGLDACFPEIAKAPFVETWAGMIETSPDIKPIISVVDELPGLYVATGFSGHGFGIGPGAGHAIAGMITGHDGDVALDAFRLSRFSDGSPLDLGPTV